MQITYTIYVEVYIIKGIVDSKQPDQIKQILLKEYRFGEGLLEIGDFETDRYIIMRTTYENLLIKLYTTKFRKTISKMKIHDDEKKMFLILEGNVKTAFMNKHKIANWNYNPQKKGQMINAISTLISKHNINLIASEGIFMSAHIIGRMAVKKYEDIELDFIQEIESPIKQLGPSKFVELACYISVMKKKPFTKMTKDEILDSLEIFKRSKYKITGIGERTIERVINFYQKN